VLFFDTYLSAFNVAVSGFMQSQRMARCVMLQRMRILMMQTTEPGVIRKRLFWDELFPLPADGIY
jgi:hypothetical protein